jgi:hypothetical protein
MLMGQNFEVFPAPIAAAFSHPAAAIMIGVHSCGQGACIPRTLIFQHRTTVPTVTAAPTAQRIDVHEVSLSGAGC